MKGVACTAVIAALLSTTVACASLVPGQAKQAPASSTVEVTTYVYATRDGQKLHLDRRVDNSVEVTGKRPVIIFSFGGG